MLTINKTSFHSTNLLSERRHHLWFPSLVAYIICFGYIFCGRGFAGLHIPGIPIYPGEVLLMMSCVYFFKEFNRTGFTGFQTILLFVLAGFGIFLLKDILFSGHDIENVFRDSATAYYVLFLFLYSGRRGAPFFTRIVDVLSKYHLLIGLSLLLHALFSPFLSRFLVIGNDHCGLFLMPDCLVPSFASLLIVVLAEKEYFEKTNRLKMVTLSISILAIVLCQSRGGILGALLALGYYICFLAKDSVRFFLRVAVTAFLLAVLVSLFLPALHAVQQRLYTDVKHHEFNLYSQEGLVAKFKELVKAEGGDYKGFSGRGRLLWWHNVIKKGKASTETLMFGQGFGYNLGESINYAREGTRGAHNAWINVFGWTGLIGVFLYSLPFLGVFIIFTSARKRLSKDDYTTKRLACNTGLVFVIAALVSSMFDNSLSSPVTEIPLFIYLGCAVSMLRDYYPGIIRKRNSKFFVS